MKAFAGGDYAQQLDNESRIMVLNVGRRMIGIVVDAVSEVLRVAKDQIAPPPPTVAAFQFTRRSSPGNSRRYSCLTATIAFSTASFRATPCLMNSSTPSTLCPPIRTVRFQPSGALRYMINWGTTGLPPVSRSASP